MSQQDSVCLRSPALPNLRHLAATHWRRLGLPKIFLDRKGNRRDWYLRNQEKQAAYQSRYHREHLTQRRASNAVGSHKRTALKRKFVDALKDSIPCFDCKKAFPSVCMDFDHLPGHKKSAGIAAMIGRHTYSIEDLRFEIEKCQLVCANCHRIRTHLTRKNMMPKEESHPLKENPAGGANIRHSGPFDYSPEMDEETNRKEAMERYDKDVNNPVRTIL